MNDFLGSLIARNLTQAETLLPRPVSWFEPRAPDLSPAARARPEPVAALEDPGAERELPWLESVDTILAPPPPAPRQSRPRPNQAMAPPPAAPEEAIATTVETLPVTPLEPSHQPLPAPSARRPGPRPVTETPATDALPGQAASQAPDQAPEATAPPVRPDQAPEAMVQAAPTPIAPVTRPPVVARRAALQPPTPVSPSPQPVEIAPAASNPPSDESVVAPASQPAPRQPRPSSLAATPRPAETPSAERSAAASMVQLREPLAPPTQRLAPVESADDHEPRVTARPPAEEGMRRAPPVAAATELAPLTPGGNAAATAVQPVVRVVEPVTSLRPAFDGARGEPRPGPASPEPLPTIQVTIGRIEVRATPAPVAPAASRRAAPAMSLEEYLRQRSQGGRR